jgi:hypothetical protein
MLPQTPSRYGMQDRLTNLSIGMGRGLTDQLEGTKQLVTQPVATAQALIEAARQMGTDPRIVLDMLRAARQKAMSGSLGLGELIGGNVPMGVRGAPKATKAVGPYKPKPSPELEVDNPGGNWLQENREYSESQGYLPSGAPRSFGKVTAVWRDPNKSDIGTVYLPVSMLKQFRGVMDEQNNVRQKDLDWLTENMGKTKSLPKTSSGKDYQPFITVDQRGIPFVSEGNHRIMAAEKLGWEWLPVEVRYFNGGEQVDGPLNPERLKAFLSQVEEKP